MEDINCVPQKIAKRRYSRRCSSRTTENPLTVIDTATQMSLPEATVGNETNCIPQKITKRRYTRRNSCKTMENTFNATTSVSVMPKQSCVPVIKKSSVETELSHSLPPVVTGTNCVAKKITKRRYTRRNSYKTTEISTSVIDVPTAPARNSNDIQPSNSTSIVGISSSDPNLSQSEPPAIKNINWMANQISKRRYTRGNNSRNSEDPFTTIDIPKLTLVPFPQLAYGPVMKKFPSEPELSQSEKPVLNDENSAVKKITKRRYTRRNSYRTAENHSTMVETGHLVLIEQPVNGMSEEDSFSFVMHNDDLWYHRKSYNFLRSLKRDYKRFKYLFNYLLKEEQEKERRNVQELDELKRIYNRMQVEKTENKRKRWCRYCELEATYLTSVGMQFYCCKECERKQNSFLSAVENSFKQHTE